MGPVLVEATRQGSFLILQFAGPGRPLRNIGVLLLDVAANRVRVRLVENFQSLADPDDQEVLACLADDLESKAGEMGGEAFLQYLEDTLSNSLIITRREPVRIERGLDATLERLFDRHVEKVPLIPFVRHVPVYSLRAAAGKFGEDMEVEAEAEDWIPGPRHLRLSDDMFVAHVVGRSMLPRIPDGSMCLFRGNVVGTRQNKLVLVELLSERDTSARYTVKRYKSAKLATGQDKWEHSTIRLEPLNPEFEPLDLTPDRFRVIGEFSQVSE